MGERLMSVGTAISGLLAVLLALGLAAIVVVGLAAAITAFARRVKLVAGRRGIRRELRRDWWPGFEADFRRHARGGTSGVRDADRGA
jgi:hypothetical protein